MSKFRFGTGSLANRVHPLLTQAAKPTPVFTPPGINTPKTPPSVTGHCHVCTHGWMRFRIGEDFGTAHKGRTTGVFVRILPSSGLRQAYSSCSRRRGTVSGTSSTYVARGSHPRFAQRGTWPTFLSSLWSLCDYLAVVKHHEGPVSSRRAVKRLPRGADKRPKHLRFPSVPSLRTTMGYHPHSSQREPCDSLSVLCPMQHA